MKVLVAGCGYIGSMLVPRLLHKDWRVTVVSRFSRGVPVLAAQCADKALTIDRMDIHDLSPAVADRHDFVVDLTEPEGCSVIGDKAGVTLNLATVFGMSPCMRIDTLVNDLTLRAVRDGYALLWNPDQRRSFVHVRDVVSAILHAIENYDAMRGQVFNVANPACDASKGTLAAAIERWVPNCEYPYAEMMMRGDANDRTVSADKLMATGWEPRHSLDDGIAELVKGYKMMGIA